MRDGLLTGVISSVSDRSLSLPIFILSLSCRHSFSNAFSHQGSCCEFRGLVPGLHYINAAFMTSLMSLQLCSPWNRSDVLALGQVGKPPHPLCPGPQCVSSSCYNKVSLSDSLLYFNQINAVIASGSVWGGLLTTTILHLLPDTLQNTSAAPKTKKAFSFYSLLLPFIGILSKTLENSINHSSCIPFPVI